jgi:hypothetical protein
MSADMAVCSFILKVKLGTRKRWWFSIGRFIPWQRASGAHRIRGWWVLEFLMEAVKKRKISASACNRNAVVQTAVCSLHWATPVPVIFILMFQNLNNLIILSGRLYVHENWQAIDVLVTADDSFNQAYFSEEMLGFFCNTMKSVLNLTYV